jgi:hypothetical protein
MLTANNATAATVKNPLGDRSAVHPEKSAAIRIATEICSKSSGK